MNSNLNILVYDSNKSSLQRIKKIIKQSAEKGDSILPVQNDDLLDHALTTRSNDILVFSFQSTKTLKENVLRKISELSGAHEVIVVYEESIKKSIIDFCRVVKVQCISHNEVSSALFRVMINILRDKRELNSNNNHLKTKLEEYQHGIYEIISNMKEPVIVIDSNGNIEYSNKMAENAFSTSEKELKGILLPLDISKKESQIKIKNEFINIESEVKISGIRCSEKKLYMVSFKNKTNNETLSKIENQEIFFQEILNALPYPMYLKDGDGVFRMCNDKYCDFIGKDMNNIIGSTIFELMPAEFSTKCTLSDNKILATNSDIKYRIDITKPKHSDKNILNHKTVFTFPESDETGIIGILIDITDHIQLQNKLKLNEEKFRALFQFSNDAIVIHSFDMKIIDVNQKAIEMFEYDYYELTHNSIDELDKLKLYSKHLSEAIENGFSRYDTTFITRFGKDKDVEVSICIIDYDKHLVHTNIRFITPRKTVEKADKFNDSLFDVLFATSDVAIFIENGDSVIVAANKAASEMFGYTEMELLQLKTSDLQPEHIKIQHKPISDEYSSKTKTTRTIGITKTRNLLDIEVKSTEVCIQESVMYVSTIRDVSDKAKLEGKIIENRKIETSWNLVKNIADNFSTPAQIIINNTSFIKDAFSDISENLKHIYFLLNKNNKSVNQKEIGQILESYNELDILELLKEIPEAINETTEEVERISTVINAVKEISLPDKDTYTYYNVNKLLENALLLAKSEYDCTVNITTILDDNIPFTIGFPNQINEVFLILFKETFTHLKNMDSTDSPYLKVTTSFKETYYDVEIEHSGTCSSQSVIEYMNQSFLLDYKEKMKNKFECSSFENFSNPFTSVSKIITINHKGNFSVDLNNANSTLYQITIPVKSSDNDAMIEKLREN